MNRRDQLLKTAVNLFRRHGYQATAIDRILSESGVSKPTLYRHFDSKDALIMAALEVWDVEWRGLLIDAMSEPGVPPRERLLALYDVLEAWFEDDMFRGCMFINATVEFSEESHPAHKVTADHKRVLAAQIRDIVARGGADDPEETAAALMLLMEGAVVTAHLFGDTRSARLARIMAEGILDQPGIA
ncbi:MAG: TetR/AcrR family transcriptional regulator [Geminicoccales bacterium]